MTSHHPLNEQRLRLPRSHFLLHDRRFFFSRELLLLAAMLMVITLDAALLSLALSRRVHLSSITHCRSVTESPLRCPKLECLKPGKSTISSLTGLNSLYRKHLLPVTPEECG